MVTSPITPTYNCIAWAAGDTRRFWWPQDQVYWPPGAVREETIDAFVHAFATLGYSVCDTAEREDGIEKVAIYAIGDEPKHAARQLESGTWTSKLGCDVDIEHPLDGVAGDVYGHVVRVLQRPR